MGLIRRLPAHEAVKIAAGEVVERPGNIVKELIENALDAGAKNIRVSVADGGKASIRIIDDGCGMDSDDAQLCFEHHATSKISSVDELQSITSFGFRGEALSSIASVSQVSLLTRQKDQSVGTKLVVRHGTIAHRGQQSCSVGTDITITNLFDNIPARKKFLKKKETELRHIQQLIMAYALANTDVSFRLEHNQTRLIHVREASTLSERMMQLKEQLSIQQFIQLDEARISDGSTVSGVISNHQTYRYDRSLLFCFVNGRWVKNFQLSNACIRGYSNVLPHGRYPAAAVFITVDPRLIDINVHPRKEEVQFAHSQRICSLITGHIKESLETHTRSLLNPALTKSNNILPTNPPVPHKEPHHSLTTTQGLSQGAPSTHYEQLDSDFRSTITLSASDKQPKQVRSESLVAHKDRLPATKSDQHHTESMQHNIQHTTTKEPSLLILGQLLKTYILVEHEKGLVLVDQHAAHERILYEQLLGNFEAVSPIRLLFPEIIELDSLTIQLLETILPVLNKCGLEIEQSGPTGVVVRSRPAYTQRLNIKELLLEISASIQKEAPLHEEDINKKVSWHVHSHMACKAAVRAGDELDVQRMQDLVRQLFSCPNQLTCPHGRPTTWKLTGKEIERAFKRKA